MKENGFSLIEAMLAIACASIVIFGAAHYLPSALTFFRHMIAGENLNLQAQQCTNLISHQLSNAQAGTVKISSTDPLGPPSSSISFVALDQTAVEIAWSSQPPDSVHLRRTPAGSATTNDSLIATKVVSLIFYLADFRDPSVIHFSLYLKAPYDATGREGSTSALISNQTVQTVMPH